MLDAPLLASLVAEARLAPSVHNIQPTRWALAGPATILLLEAPDRRLPAADPHGRDVAISHGAAMEGMLLALAARGVAATPGPGDYAPPGRLRPVASLKVEPGPVVTDCGKLAQRRATWRGRFRRPAAETRSPAERLAGDDLVVVTEPAAIASIGALGDEAAMFFLRDDDHRRELLHWMRLSRAHPDWTKDGLNARAMDLGRLEAAAAGLVLGPLFRPLDRLGAAAPLLSEKTKTESAAAILLFHRPAGEDPVTTGRAFYRRWLDIEGAGLAACPISVLADCPRTNSLLASAHSIPNGRELIGVFRAGEAPTHPKPERARLPLNELIVA